MWEWLADHGIEALGFGGYVAAGSLALLGYFKKDNARRTESDALADGLISRLKETVEQQTEDIKAMSGTLETQQKEIHQLQGQNEAYLNILSLRDPAAQKVFSEAPAIFQIAKDNNRLSAENGRAIAGLTDTLTKFIDELRPLLIHLNTTERANNTV